MASFNRTGRNFFGETYICGNATAFNYYTVSDCRLKENITSLKEESQSTLSNVMDINVVKYNYLDRNEGSKETISSIDTSQKHYGMLAQELQAIYPELVKEGQDGYLAVNYIELVPILIRSIQELKEELDDVKGESGTLFRARSTMGSKMNISLSDGNILYQNKPNPFKEQTTISFHLADNITDAAVCIFDLTGKMLKKLSISSGENAVIINSRELGEGIFLYSLVVNGTEVDSKRMIITK